MKTLLHLHNLICKDNKKQTWVTYRSEEKGEKLKIEKCRRKIHRKILLKLKLISALQNTVNIICLPNLPDLVLAPAAGAGSSAESRAAVEPDTDADAVAALPAAGVPLSGTYRLASSIVELACQRPAASSPALSGDPNVSVWNYGMQFEALSKGARAGY